MVFAAFILIAGIVSFFCLSNDLNCKLEIEEDYEQSVSLSIQNEIPYKKFFTSLRSVFALLTCTYVCVIF
jgi:hypothetical protein